MDPLPFVSFFQTPFCCPPCCCVDDILVYAKKIYKKREDSYIVLTFLSSLPLPLIFFSHVCIFGHHSKVKECLFFISHMRTHPSLSFPDFLFQSINYFTLYSIICPAFPSCPALFFPFAQYCTKHANFSHSFFLLRTCVSSCPPLVVFFHSFLLMMIVVFS